MSDPLLSTPSFSSRRRWSIGLNELLSVIAVLALVLMANYYAARHFSRSTWMAENPNQLTPLTARLLQTMTNQVKVVVFFDKQDSLGLYSSVSALLNEYQLVCPRLHVEYVDYVRNPSAALVIKDRYKLSFLGDDYFKNLVIFESEGRSKIVYEKELYDLDFSGPISGKSRNIKRSNFKGELMFTSAIINVLDVRRFKACFLQGHKEHYPQDDDPYLGYAKFTALLQQMNIQVELLATNGGDIPDDCQLLIIAGPQQLLETAEVAKIEQFLNRGGRLLTLFNNLNLNWTSTGLERMLASWGVSVGNNVLMEDQTMNKGADLPSAISSMIITNYPTPSHPICKPLLRTRLQVVMPRSVEKQLNGKQDADSPKVEELAASGPNSSAITSFRNGVAYANPLQDRRGPISMIVAVEKGGVQGVSDDRGATRIIVVGDSICLGNHLMDWNRDFAVLAVNWLLDRTKLMGGIGPRPVKEYRVVMTSSQMFAVRWLLLAVLPGAVFAIGILVWFRRRT